MACSRRLNHAAPWVGSAALHLEVEGLEVGFRALRQFNAECHASVGAE